MAVWKMPIEMMEKQLTNEMNMNFSTTATTKASQKLGEIEIESFM